MILESFYKEKFLKHPLNYIQKIIQNLAQKIVVNYAYNILENFTQKIRVNR